MKVRCKPAKYLSGRVEAPPSKSYTHRAFIVGLLADGRSIIKSPLISEDTQATINACRLLGAEIYVKNNNYVIEGTGGNLSPPEKVIDVMNSGTTLRLITAISSLTNATLTGDESIKKRPNQPLLDALNQLGIKAFSLRGNGCAPITIEGGDIIKNFVQIRGDISSQFVSGLLLLGPLLENGLRIELTTELKSLPYIMITLEILKEAGVEIEFHENRFEIKNQSIRPIKYHIPGDYSSSSYIFAASSMVESDVYINNLAENTVQGDYKIVEILKDMGTLIKSYKTGFQVIGGEDLKGLTIDAKYIPDLVPTLAVLGVHAKGCTTIFNAEHVRYKESDRISAMYNELSKMGANIMEKADGLVVNNSRLRGQELHGYNDHRIVMALAIAGLIAEGSTIIDTAESIKISFPNFVESMRDIGMEIEII